MEKKLNIAVYPGSFDPITNGHLDIISRSSKLFDKVIVGISKSSNSKNYLFTDKERLELVNDCTKHLKNVEPIVFDGLLVDFAKNNKIFLPFFFLIFDIKRATLSILLLSSLLQIEIVSCKNL